MTRTLPVCRAGAWQTLGACLGLAASTLCCAAPADMAASTAPPPGAAAPRPLPWDANADVPPLSYRSALAGYRPAADLPRTPWREANDTVGRIGGWRSYAREAQGADGTAQPTAPARAEGAGNAATPFAPAASTPARPGAHHQHGM